MLQTSGKSLSNSGFLTALHPLASIRKGVSSDILVADDIVRSGGIIGVSEQFLSEAATYDERYFATDAMIAHLSHPLDLSGLDLSKVRSVLDIGCGSGNATFALAKLFPEAEITASDFSPEMLLILEARAKSLGVSDRIKLVVADATTADLQKEVFDIVIGSSMLHHLVNPEAATIQLLKAVKRGGSAFFFEPFAPGYVVLNVVFRALISLNEAKGGFSDEAIRCMESFAFGTDFVISTKRDHPALINMDDKWQFTVSQFKKVARMSGCDLRTYTTNPLDEKLSSKIRSMIFSATGSEVSYPDWAMNFMESLEVMRTPDIREDLLMEGGLIFNKPEL